MIIAVLGNGQQRTVILRRVSRDQYSPAAGRPSALKLARQPRLATECGCTRPMFGAASSAPRPDRDRTAAVVVEGSHGNVHRLDRRRAWAGARRTYGELVLDGTTSRRSSPTPPARQDAPLHPPT
jgi:hypothetical protein